MINQYKRVDSAGTFMNNMSEKQTIPYASKVNFLKQYKFTIACESVSFPGFITEKLVHPYFAYSIPIYYGDPSISEEFNTDSMIWIPDISLLENAGHLGLPIPEKLKAILTQLHDRDRKEEAE